MHGARKIVWALFELGKEGNRGNYFFSESATHTLCRMLSTVAPWGSHAAIWDPASVDCRIVDGKLETVPNIDE